MKIYLYHHRGKTVNKTAFQPRPAPPLSGEDLELQDHEYLDTITALTAQGRTAEQIGAVVGRSASWVHRYRSRNNVEISPQMQRRPRAGSAERRPKRRARQRAEDAPPGTWPKFPWLPPELLIASGRPLLLIEPLREARPPAPGRRLTFDLEDTEEL